MGVVRSCRPSAHSTHQRNESAVGCCGCLGLNEQPGAGVIGAGLVERQPPHNSIRRERPAIRALIRLNQLGSHRLATVADNLWGRNKRAAESCGERAAQ